MAQDPANSFLGWALQTAPYLVPPLVPLYSAAKSVAGSAQAATRPEAGVPEIGAEKDYGQYIGSKVYTGPNYGYQTLDTATKLDPTKVSPDATQQAEFRRLQQVLASKAAAGRKPASETKEPATTPEPSQPEPRGTESPTKTGIPGQEPAAQKPDPQVDYYNKLLERMMDPELRAQLAAQDTEQAIRRALVTNALAMRQTRENTQRQVQLKNIEAWRDLERTRIEANARQAMALGQTIAAAMVPNQGLGQVLNQAYASAMAPFQDFQLK